MLGESGGNVLTIRLHVPDWAATGHLIERWTGFDPSATSMWRSDAAENHAVDGTISELSPNEKKFMLS